MARKKQMENEQVLQTADFTNYNKESTEPVELTHTAVSTYKDEAAGVWRVVTIKYNPITGDVGKPEIVPCNEADRETNRNLFRTTVVKHNII